MLIRDHEECNNVHGYTSNSNYGQSYYYDSTSNYSHNGDAHDHNQCNQVRTSQL